MKKARIAAGLFTTLATTVANYDCCKAPNADGYFGSGATMEPTGRPIA